MLRTEWKNTVPRLEMIPFPDHTSILSRSRKFGPPLPSGAQDAGHPLLFAQREAERAISVADGGRSIPRPEKAAALPTPSLLPSFLRR